MVKWKVKGEDPEDERKVYLKDGGAVIYVQVETEGRTYTIAKIDKIRNSLDIGYQGAYFNLFDKVHK